MVICDVDHELTNWSWSCEIWNHVIYEW